MKKIARSADRHRRFGDEVGDVVGERLEGGRDVRFWG
jgi:hypothetical protein